MSDQPLDTPADPVDLVERAGTHLAARQSTLEAADSAREAARGRLPALLDDVREVAALVQTAFGPEAVQPATLVLAAPDRWRDEMRERAVLVQSMMAYELGRVMAEHAAPSHVDQLVLNLSTGVLALDRPRGGFARSARARVFSSLAVSGSVVVLLAFRGSPWTVGLWIAGIVLAYGVLRYMDREAPVSLAMCDDPVGAVATLEDWLATWRGRLLATPGSPDAALPVAPLSTKETPAEGGADSFSGLDWG